MCVMKTKTYHVHSQEYELVVEEMGQGSPMIFAHGLGANREVVKQQWACVADRYRVICFDQRGHGDSIPVTDPEVYQPELMGQDIVNILKALEIPKAVIGGVSMGACAALHCAAEYPKRVQALLQSGPAFNEQVCPEHRELSRLGDLLANRGIEGTVQIIGEEWRDLGMPTEAFLEMEQLYRGYHPQSMSVACRTVAKWKVPPGMWGKIDVPVAILAWRDDPIHDIRIAEEMAAAIPDAQLREIPGVFTPDLGEIFHRDFLVDLNWS